VTPPPLAVALKEELPEVREAVTFSKKEKILVEYEHKRFSEEIGFSNASLFSIFTLPLTKGTPETVLADPSSLVIEEDTARKYFGSDDPIGKSLTLNNRLTQRVTGVMKKIPENSVLHCPIIIPFRQYEALTGRGNVVNWGNFGYSTFVLLDKKANFEAVCAKLEDYLDKKLEDNNIRLSLQPLNRIHLYALEGGGPILYLYIFSAVAIFILIIACINFMNLATARSATRAREIGVRKVVGADRKRLILQFLGESIFMALVAWFFALLLALSLLRPLRRLVEIPSGLEFMDFKVILFFLIIAVLTGILEGSYPALFLSSFKPASILRGRQRAGSPLFRKVLVVFQFAVSITLLVCMFLISRQIDYLSQKPLGFNKDHIVYIPINEDLRRRFEIMKQELLKHPNIQHVTGTSSYLGQSPKWSSETVNWEEKDPNDHFLLYMISVDFDFAEMFEVKMAEGRFYARDFKSDDRSFILNETAIKAMGIESPIGKEMEVFDKQGKIIGIVEDFNFRPLHWEVQPLLLAFEPDWHSYIAIKIAPENVSGTLTHIEKLFKRFSPEYPFEYNFLDENLERQYKAEFRSRRLFQYFVFLAAFISCLGLFGLSSFMVEKRTKEVGVRKILGASTAGIILLLSKEYVKWVLLANIIAWPVAYYTIQRWLQGFAYRINISFMIFIASAVISVMIALLTVSYQALKAATAEPVDSLRYE